MAPRNTSVRKLSREENKLEFGQEFELGIEQEVGPKSEQWIEQEFGEEAEQARKTSKNSAKNPSKESSKNSVKIRTNRARIQWGSRASDQGKKTS